MVVPVLITSCQVSEKPNTGPRAAQTMIAVSASANALVLPVHVVMAPAKRSVATPKPPFLSPTVAGERRGGEVAETTAGELLPGAFGADALGNSKTSR